MDWTCPAYNTSSLWQSECLYNWINFSSAVFSMLINLLLIVFLGLTRDRGKKKLTNGRSFGHDFRNITELLLLLTHILELCDALLSRTHNSVLPMVVASFAFWASALALSHMLESTGKFRVFYVTAVLLAANGLARVLRLRIVVHNGVSWWCIRPASAAAASILYAILTLTSVSSAYVNTGIYEEAISKYRYKHDQAHFYSKSTFYWITPLLKAGYSCPLEAEDLGPLPEMHKAKIQLERFDTIYQRQIGICGGTAALWRTCFLFTLKDFLLGGVLKLIGDMLTLVPPVGITAFVRYLASANDADYGEHARLDDVWRNGWSVSAVVIVACIAQSTCSHASNHLGNICGIHLNTAIQAKLYTKVLQLSNSKQASEKGKQEEETGSATTLMTEDATNIMSAVWIGHLIWAIPLKIIMIMVVLYEYLGTSALIGGAVIIITVTPLQVLLGRKLTANSASMADVTDCRIQLLSSLIENFKLLKMLGWQEIFTKKIQDIRKKEEEKLNVDSFLWSAMAMVSQFSRVIVAVISLGVYSGEEPLTPATIFAVLALFNQLNTPLFLFPMAVPIYISAYLSGKRISKFLNMPEVENMLPATISHEVPGSFVHCLPEQFSCSNSMADVTSFSDAAGSKPAYDNNVDMASPEDGADVDCDGVTRADAITIEGVYAWPGSSDWQLVLKKVVIPKGKMTVIVGNVGSGKTSLLAAILGEMVRVTGSITWGRSPVVAYAGQTPWLLNATIKDNITFGRPFRPKRYSHVIEACSLKPDFDILPDQDLTEVGDRGINLSGGQKQRIAVARALYSHANIVILDDPLSSLDQEVANHVFEAGILRLVRRGKRTVLLVTHNLNLLSHAYKVIAMEDGHVRIQGQPMEIETLDPALAAGWRNLVGKDVSKEGRTAGERWKLIQLVSSIGLELKHKMMDPQEDFEQGVHKRSTSKRRPAFLEWSYLSGDLPSEIEDMRVIRPARRKRRMTRAYSLQTSRNVRVSHPVTRQLSTPPAMSARRTQSLLGPMMRKMQSKRQETPTHQTLQRLSSNESGFSDAKSDIDPDELNDMDVGAHHAAMEDRHYGTIPCEVFLMYGAACGAFATISYFLTCILSQFIRVLADTSLSRWNDLVEAPEKTTLYIWIYVGLSLLTLAIPMVSQGACLYGASRARVTIHRRLLTHLNSCSVSAISATPAGRILNRFSTDVNAIDKKIAPTIHRLQQFVLICLSGIVVNAIVSPWFLIAGVPLCWLFCYVQIFYRTSSRELQRIDGLSRSPVVSHLVETTSGLSTIRAYGYQPKFSAGFFSKLDQNAIAVIISNSSIRWLGIVLEYMGAATVGLAMLTALVTAHVAPGNVSPALAGLGVNYTLVIPIFLNWLVKFLSEAEMYMSAVERVHHILKQPTDTTLQSQDEGLSQLIPESGEISFENVSLRYSDITEPVFIGLNLHIPMGQKIGICGRSGSGKSTLTLALFRLMKSTAGRLLLGGRDITHIPHHVVASHIAVVPQDAAVLPGTVRDNLDPCRKELDPCLWQALDAVHLGEAIRSKTAQLDEDMSQIGLSSGERQLLCLARALLRPAQVLVMDEASSSLDEEAEARLMAAALHAFRHKTIIIIAHRLSTLLTCDRILVIERGRIAEDGSPDQLLQRQMGLFSTMLKASDHLNAL